MDAWTRRYRFHLESIPELLALSRGRLVPLQAQQFGGERVSGGVDPRKLPLRAEAVDDADLLWALLVLYAREVADIAGGWSPPTIRYGSWSTSREVQGLPPGVDGEQARQLAHEVVSWLVRASYLVAQHPELQESEDQLFGLVRSLRARHGVGERLRPALARRCAVCRLQTVVTTYATVGGVEQSHARCTTCGAVDAEALGAVEVATDG